MIEQQWTVYALRRRLAKSATLGEARIKWRTGDILDPGSLRAAMPEKVNAVFHVAGDTNTWSKRNAKQWAVNVEGTRNVVATALIQKAARFVHTSTVCAYGHGLPQVNESSDSNAPDSWINYERSKWEGEQIVRAAAREGLPAIIIAPGAIMGPGDRKGWSQLIIQLSAGRLRAIPPGMATFNHVDDVVDAHLAAVEAGRCGDTYLLPGESIRFTGLAELIAHTLGIQYRAKATPSAILKGLARVMATISAVTGKEPALTPEMATLLCSDITIESRKAALELGYRPRPLRTAVADACAWLVQEGLIDLRIRPGRS